MPTIKHIVAQDYGIGIETIYEASQTQAKTIDRGLNTPLVKSVTFSDKSGASHEILDGLVYVMNDVGKTIAKYEFDLDMDAAALQIRKQLQGASPVDFTLTTGTHTPPGRAKFT